MKIKELFENEQLQKKANVANFEIVLEFADVPSNIEVERYINRVKPLLSKFAPSININYDRGILHVVLYHIGQSIISKISDIYNEVFSILEDTLTKYSDNEFAGGTTNLLFGGVPVFEVKYDIITIVCSPQTKSLSDLDKVIKSCSELTIENIELLKGPMLSLFKTKADYIYFEGGYGEVFNLISKNFDKYFDNKDIFGFQQFLLEHELKEYAKF
jgi:hypothetical protein